MFLNILRFQPQMFLMIALGVTNQLVVDGMEYTRDFHFPQESRQKFQNMPKITPFQITLSFLVIRIENTPDFHLALRQQRKKISDFSSIHHRR